MMSTKPRDLGLSYLDAAHAMQSGVSHEMNLPSRARTIELKHLRVGINSALSDSAALAYLLIEKGVFTEAEYGETVRLFMNEEVVRYEELHTPLKFR